MDRHSGEISSSPGGNSSKNFTFLKNARIPYTEGVHFLHVLQCITLCPNTILVEFQRFMTSLKAPGFEIRRVNYTEP